FSSLRSRMQRAPPTSPLFPYTTLFRSQLTQVPLGILIVILNIPFIFLGYKQIGKTFTIYSVIGMASLAFGTSVMHHIPTIIEGDTLLVTVIGGIIIGFGMGVALRNCGSLDGVDVL